MEEKINNRFNELIKEGQLLLDQIPTDSKGHYDYWVPAKLTNYHSWIYSVANFLKFFTYANSNYSIGMDTILNDPEMRNDIGSKLFEKVFGILNSAYSEWKAGMLTRIEFIIAAETFDDFLSHSEEYHKANRKTEASVLASAVLEDTLKKIAYKYNVAQNLSLESLIDELTKQNVFTPVKAKKYKSFASIRNSASHARWEEFDIKDVGYLIKGVKELIEDYL